MARVPKPLNFQWDKGNIDKNLKKHKVTNKESEEIFFDKSLKIFPDERHSQKEKRYIALGITNESRKLTIVFIIRGQELRIISVRDQNKKERIRYEKK